MSVKKTYSEKLKDPRWQKKRLEVLERDKWTCQGCSDKTSTLHVHHQYYISGKEPWEYQNTCFLTLCESCHESEERYKKEYEQLLIQTIYDAGFKADDMLEIAAGFSKVKNNGKKSWMKSAVIRAVLEDENLLNHVASLIFRKEATDGADQDNKA